MASEINSSSLAPKLEKSDIVQIIHNVDGVDNVILNSIVITRRENEYYDTEALVVEDIQAEANEYFEAGSINISSVEG